MDGQASSVPVQTRDSALTAGLSSGGASRGRGGGDGVGTRTSVGGGWKEDISLVRSWRNRWLGGNEALTRVHAGKESAQGMGGALVVKPRIRRRAGLVEQFRLLLSRSWRQVNRAKFANMTRVRNERGSPQDMEGLICFVWLDKVKTRLRQHANRTLDVIPVPSPPFELHQNQSCLNVP